MISKCRHYLNTRVVLSQEESTNFINSMSSVSSSNAYDGTELSAVREDERTELRADGHPGTLRFGTMEPGVTEEKTGDCLDKG